MHACLRTSGLYKHLQLILTWISLFFQVSVLPRCSRVTDILDAHTLLEALGYLVLAAADALAAIFTESYLSLIAVLCLYMLCWCMAKSGGYGTIPGPAPQPPPGKRESFWESMALRCASYCHTHAVPYSVPLSRCKSLLVSGTFVMTTSLDCMGSAVEEGIHN